MHACMVISVKGRYMALVEDLVGSLGGIPCKGLAKWEKSQVLEEMVHEGQVAKSKWCHKALTKLIE